MPVGRLSTGEMFCCGQPSTGCDECSSTVVELVDYGGAVGVCDSAVSANGADGTAVESAVGVREPLSPCVSINLTLGMKARRMEASLKQACGLIDEDF